jgi:hypothetical protein
MGLGYGIIFAMQLGHFHSEYIYIVIKMLKALGLLPGAVAAYFVRHWWQGQRQQRAQEGWPSVDAVVVGSKVVREGWRNYWAEITYTYFVDEYRTGNYLRKFSHKDDADAFVREMRDKRPRVHFKESAPDTSTMLDRDLEMIAPLAIRSR